MGMYFKSTHKSKWFVIFSAFILDCSPAYSETNLIDHNINEQNSSLTEKILIPVTKPYVGKIDHYVNAEIEGKKVTPTAIYFHEAAGIEIVTDFSHHRFVYRNIGSQTWSASNFTSLDQPHSLVYVESANAYFAVDTNNDRLVAFPLLSSQESDLVDYSTLGTFSFSSGDRPHDIVFNPNDGYVYVIYKRGLMRFQASGSGVSNVEVLTKADIEAGLGNFVFQYSRSLSLIANKVYISSSRQGNIVEIGNFSDFTTWIVRYNQNTVEKNNQNSKQKPTLAPAGIWDVHGLIINDVEYLDGYWFATNEYHDYQENIYNDTEKRTNKLIRWKSWDDFYNSNWDDLGHLVPNGSNAYYLTVRQGKLYLSAFKTSNIERSDANVVIRFD